MSSRRPPYRSDAAKAIGIIGIVVGGVLGVVPLVFAGIDSAVGSGGWVGELLAWVSALLAGAIAVILGIIGLTVAGHRGDPYVWPTASLLTGIGLLLVVGALIARSN